MGADAKQACAEVGAKHGKTAYQVALRWITQSGASFTVEARSAAHFAEERLVEGGLLAAPPLATRGRLGCETSGLGWCTHIYISGRVSRNIYTCHRSLPKPRQSPSHAIGLRLWPLRRTS